jgi:hypothetical protein
MIDDAKSRQRVMTSIFLMCRGRRGELLTDDIVVARGDQDAIRRGRSEMKAKMRRIFVDMTNRGTHLSVSTGQRYSATLNVLINLGRRSRCRMRERPASRERSLGTPETPRLQPRNAALSFDAAIHRLFQGNEQGVAGLARFGCKQIVSIAPSRRMVCCEPLFRFVVCSKGTNRGRQIASDSGVNK